MAENQSAKKESDLIPLKEKLAYSFANMPGTFFGSMMGVIQSFYYAWMGLQWGWITIAQIIYAIWNVVNDPIFGNRINNTKYLNKRGELQRYIPYIKYGAPLFSLAFALVFFPPDTLRGKSNFSFQFWLFVWYLVSQLAYDTMFTIVLCAWVALLPQMSLNQREREKTQLLCSIFLFPAVIIGFALPVALLSNPTPNSIFLFQVLVVIISIFGVIPYWIVAKYVFEHPEFNPEKSVGILKSIKLAFKNRSYIVYLIYDGISVFIININMVTLPFFLHWVLGNSPGFNPLLFWIGPIICLFLGTILSLKIAEKKSTKFAITIYLSLLSIGFLLTFLFALTGNWIMVSVGFSIIFLGYPGDFIHHNPMRADTIDYDQWKISSERREGLYAGIGPLISKPMISVALAVPPIIMTANGLIYVKDSLQPTMGLEMAQLGLNISMCLIPGVVALIGLIIWILFYPLRKDLVIEMKGELAKINEEMKLKYQEKQK
ncbi:MAG: MFS transporter [Promethearchaeota archaeon]